MHSEHGVGNATSEVELHLNPISIEDDRPDDPTTSLRAGQRDDYVVEHIHKHCSRQGRGSSSV